MPQTRLKFPARPRRTVAISTASTPADEEEAEDECARPRRSHKRTPAAAAANGDQARSCDDRAIAIRSDREDRQSAVRRSRSRLRARAQEFSTRSHKRKARRRKQRGSAAAQFENNRPIVERHRANRSICDLAENSNPGFRVDPVK